MPSGEAICLLQEEDKTGVTRPMNYQLLHDRIVSQAKTRVNTSGQYSETHHIIPKSIGGTDEEANLVSLTAREHFIIHYLLTKITTGEDKKSMIYAFRLMKGKSAGQECRYMNNRLYEANRKRLAEIQSHKCIIDGVEFSSLKEAARHYKTTIPTITQWVQKGGKSRPITSTSEKKPCIIDGIEFSSIGEASRHHRVSVTTIKRWLKEGGKSLPKIDGGKKKPCIIDGIEYPSLTEAERQLGICRKKIKRRLTKKT